MIEQIKERLGLSNYEINELSRFDAAVLKKAFLRMQAKGDVANKFKYLKAACQGIAADLTKQSVRGNDKNTGNAPQRVQSKPKPLDESKLKELANYYGLKELAAKVGRFEKCLVLAKQTHEKYPTPENERWVSDYQHSLTRWQTILNFAIDLNTIKENTQQQPNTQPEENNSTNSNVVQVDNSEIDYSLMEEDFSILGF